MSVMTWFGWFYLLIGLGGGFAAGTWAQWGAYEYGFNAGRETERYRPYRIPRG